MKLRHLAVCGCLALASCGRKPAPALAVPTPTPPSVAVPAAVPRPTAALSPAVLPTSATPEQLGSTLRLRVAFGGMPASDTAAALLRHGEITGPDLGRSDCRLALALLKGWDESRLRNADARLVIYRSKVNSQGNLVTVTFPARLVRFDPATSLALVTYLDTFEYALDAGFCLRRDGGPARADLTLLRTSQDGSRQGPRNDSRFTIEVGAYRGASNGPPRTELADRGPQQTDTVALAVGAPDLLYGFVETTAAGPTLTGLDRFDVALPLSMYEVSQVSFEKLQETGGLRIQIAVEPSAGSSPPGRLGLRVSETNHTAPGDVPAAGAGGSFAPVSPETIKLAPLSASMGPWTGRLPMPSVGQEKTYLMQLSWPVLPGDNVPETCGKPFLVKIANRAEGVFPVVLTAPVPVPGGALAAPADGVTRFALEAPALDVHSVAGGREVLIHLGGAPFWKRFSFEKNDWQPLPEHLANCVVTGNLTALFVLDLDALEVRKYRLPDLSPAGTKKLPGGDYHTVLAGTNTARAPVHLAVGGNMLSLDPDTLEERHASGNEEGNFVRQRYPSPSDGPKQFYISGDGLGIVRLDGSSRQSSYYNGDTRGFERFYLGQLPGNTADYVPGVTPGFKIDARDVSCYDTRGGTAIVQGPLNPSWGGSAGVLSENAPVVFRVLPARGNELPPRVRLGCFALLDNEPFAELEAPELTGLTAGYLPWQRWIFLDPYSRRLGTLDFARRTWHVRLLQPTGDSRPALLNWPDTSVARGGTFTFHPVMTGGDRFTLENIGRSSAPVMDTAAGTVSLPVAGDEFGSLQLLNFKLTAGGGVPAGYPILLHTTGPELPFAVPPTTKPEGLSQRGADLGTLGMSNQGFVPLKAALYPLPESFQSMVGPTAGHVALISKSGRVDLFSVWARRIVATINGSVGASYFAGLGGLLEYDPVRRTLTRLSVPAGRREASLTLPANMRLTGLAVGAEPGNAVTLALQIDHAKIGTHLSDLVVSQPLSGAMAILDGLTFKAGSRAQVSTLAHLLGQPEPFPDSFDRSIGQNTDSPPVLLPSSRDGTVVSLSNHLLVEGPDYAVGYPWEAAGAGANLTSSVGGLAGGSISGSLAFAGNGIGFKGGVAVWQYGSGSELGPTPDGRYRLHQLEAGAGEAIVEICAAENNRPLLRLGRVPFLHQPLQFSGRDEVGRRVLMLGDAGPLAILDASGRTLALVDLDIPALTRLISPTDFHVVSQPLPYVMEGRTFQYTVQVNNPAAVQSIRLQQPTPTLTINGTGTVFYTAPSSIKTPTRTVISLELKAKNGQVFLHEFPVYVLPVPRAGIKAKTGQL